ncbi:hypothetical protein McanMca71_003880 [Microsporum canis]
MEESEYKNGTSSPKLKRTSNGQMKRVSRACYNCRRRKSKCDLDSNGRPGQPPCKRCHNENLKCELGTSNRGGKRIRNTIKASAGALGSSSAVPQPARPLETSISPQSTENYNHSRYISPYNDHDRYGPSEEHRGTSIEDDDDDDSTSESAIGSGVPRNPSDAWQRLTNVAKRGTDAPKVEDGGDGTASANGHGAKKGIFAYRLVENEVLTRGLVMQLLTRYADNYHCYFPLVPRKYFDPASLDEFAMKEKHLLTAVLTVASKDLTSMPHVHEGCSKYMLELISGVAAGADCDVEAVEALLILAEWEPQGLRPSIEPVGRGEEDRAAWMHVGIALRSGYFLGLDKTSFRNDTSTGDTQTDNRKRLAWASCYVSDRLISVRIGRAFWSRGPGPMTGLVSHDFPSLQPQSPHDEDYSKIFQAILDLTQLYGNVHDVLYSGMRTSRNMMLMGDYVKYIDDFRVAISRWYRLWGKMQCSGHLNVMLQMSYEYLKLYTNAFAFQAAISQALHKPKSDSVSQRDHLRAAFSNVASMQDSRFIYESVEAAKSYLTILTNYVDPERRLHFMPLRFYLYSIYAAVFLYKARSFGVINQAEEITIRKMIDETIDRLRRASASPDDVGYRYARLLELLWKPKSSHSTNPVPITTNGITGSSNITSNNNNNSSTNNIFANTNTAPVNNNSSINAMHGPQPSNGMHELPTTCLPEPTYVQFSPANDFSWLDLEAVGDFVSGDAVTAPTILGLDSFQGLDTGYQAENHDHGSQVWPPSWLNVSDALLF